MKKVKVILHEKADKIASIDASATVYEGLAMMVDRNIGALIVLDNGSFKGIMTERDYARKVMLQGRSSRNTQIGEIMEKSPVTISPDTSVQQCMELMSDKNIRYLPVLDRGTVTGIISIGDVVRNIIDEQKNTINHLQDYIAGNV